MSLTNALKAVRAAKTAVAESLTLSEREAWIRECALLREVEASLLERLNSRAIRPVSQLSLEAR